MSPVHLKTCLSIAVLLMSMGQVFASNFKPCPGSPKSAQQGDDLPEGWHDCIGFFDSTGTVYVGEFQNGVSHGTGTMFYANGDRYEGDFKFGRPFGRGMSINSDGGSVPTCYGLPRAYGVYFCQPPAVLRTAFNDHSEMQRKRIQIELRNFGYGKAIDGLYGKGTAEALIVFNQQCQNYDLNAGDSAEKLFQAVLDLKSITKSEAQGANAVTSSVGDYNSNITCKVKKDILRKN